MQLQSDLEKDDHVTNGNVQNPENLNMDAYNPAGMLPNEQNNLEYRVKVRP